MIWSMALLAPILDMGPTDSGVSPEGEAKTGFTGPDMIVWDLKPGIRDKIFSIF